MRGGSISWMTSFLRELDMSGEREGPELVHRGGPGLVQKDQPVRFKPHSCLPRGRPLLACLPDVGPILFAGQQRFF